MRSEMAQPCCGSRARVRRISRSRVPCGRSIRGSGIVLPYGFYREHTPPLVEVQGEDSEPHAVLGSRGRTWLTMVFGLPMDREFRSLEELVPERGLEPPRPCDHCDLNAARLPVPPLGHECEKASSSVAGAACNEACSFCPAGLPLSTRCQNLHGSVRANHASSLTLPARRSCQRVKVRPVSKLL